jgi:hypothetical protein
MYQPPTSGHGAMPFGPPAGSYGMPVSGSNLSGFRFSEADRVVFGGLAANLQFVSVLWILFGVLGTLLTAPNVALQGVHGLSGFVGCVGALVQGITLRAAREHLRRVASGAGDDLSSAMAGVAGLRPYYTVMLVVTLLQVAATLLALVV